MIEILRTNDAVLISFIEALLRDAEIGHQVLDRNVSSVEGSIGIFPRRIVVDDDQAEEARALLLDAEIDVPPLGESRG